MSIIPLIKIIHVKNVENWMKKKLREFQFSGKDSDHKSNNQQ